MTKLFEDTQTPEDNQELETLKATFLKEDGTIDTDKLLKSKLESNRYINTLVRSKDEQREDFNTSARLEELLTRLSSRVPDNSPEPQADEPRVSQEASQFDPKLVAEISRKTVKQVIQEDRDQANIDIARQEMMKVWGNDASRKWDEAIKRTGLSEEALMNIAAKSPSTLLNVVGAVKKEEQANVSPPRSSMIVDGVAGITRNSKYYQNLRRTNPGLYHNPKTVMQMHEDSIHPDFHK